MSGDGDRRKKKFRRFVLRTRALVCAVAALLFVFQSVVAAAAPHSHASYDAGLSAASAQDCQFFQGKKGGPDHRMAREHCCLFCAAGGVGAAYFPVLTTYDIALPRLNPKTSTPELVVRALARPPGWRSAWSSQAPPSLS